MVTSEELEIIKSRILPIFAYFMPTFPKTKPKTGIQGHIVYDVSWYWGFVHIFSTMYPSQQVDE